MAIAMACLHAQAGEVVYRFTGQYRTMDSYLNTNDVPLIGYTVWTISRMPTVSVALVRNADPTASEKTMKNISGLAEYRATNVVESFSFVDDPPQAQKHIFLHLIAGTREKPELLLIVRFGRALVRDEREEHKRATWISRDFLNSFMRFELPNLLAELDQDKRLPTTGSSVP